MKLPDELPGREHQWERIVALFGTVSVDHGGLLLVEGRPGTGKTTLLAVTERLARQHRFTVLHQRAALVAASPGGELNGPPCWLVEQMEARVAEQASLGPVLVTLDDAHRAGALWQPVFTALPGLTARYPLIWALARRPGEGGAAIEHLFRWPQQRALRIDLGALDATVVDELITAVLGAPADAGLRDLVAAAAGEPQLTMELLRGLREDGKVAVDDDRARLLCEELPQRVLAVVGDRLRPLSAKARQILQVAASFGEVFAVHHVARMLGEPTATLLPALEELLGAGLLDCGGERLAFSHGLVWRAVRNSMPSSVHHALRHEARLMLSGSAGAGLPAQPQPGGDLVTAAAAQREELERASSAAQRAAIQCRLGHVLIMSGRCQEAAAMMEQVLGVAELPAQVRAEATAALVLALSLFDPPRARGMAEAVLADGPAGSGDAGVLLSATVLAGQLWEKGALDESLRLARSAVAQAGPQTAPAWRMHALLALARKLGNRQEFGPAHALIEQAASGLDEDARRLHAAALPIARARLLAQAGRLPEGREQARAALGLAREGGAHLLVPLAQSVLATVALRTGDLLAAAEHVRRCQAELATGVVPLWSAQYDWVEVLLTAEQDGPRQALDHIARSCADLPNRQQLFVEEPGAAAWLVRTAAAAGDLDLAKTAVHTAECLAARNPDHPAVVAAAAHARGLLDRDVAALGRAAAEQQEPWASAWAAEDLGLHLLESYEGDVASALEHLETALARFTAIGAERDASRLRTRLRALGVRRRRLPAQRSEPTGWHSLNDMERTIAHLVNQSLTNRQIAKRVFLSPHTVNYHLRQIFRKLKIKSRVELARLTQEHHPPQPAEETAANRLPHPRGGEQEPQEAPTVRLPAPRAAST